MEDKNIICKDCGKEFVFTTGEQEFYKEKDLPMTLLDVPIAEKQKSNKEIIIIKNTRTY